MTTKSTQNRQNNIIEEKAYNAPTGIFAFARSAINGQANNAPNPLNDKPNPQSPQSNAISPLPKKPNN